MDNKDAKLTLSNRVTTLNPNAAEFIPSTLRSTVRNTNGADATRLNVPDASGKALLNRSKSNISNNSDDEVHEYWRRQLPDDIIPDFKFTEEDELPGPRHLSVAGLSIHDGTETSRFSASASGQTLDTHQNISLLGANNFSLSEKLGYSSSTYSENHSSSVFMFSDPNSWDQQFVNGDRNLSNEREWHHYNGDSTTGSLNDLLGEHSVTRDAVISPLDFLALQFPGFAAESLADVYYANGCDLNLTIEILAQLELQVDGGFSQNLNSKALTAPSFNVLEFPALPISDAQNGLPKYSGADLQQVPSTYRSPSSISRGATDFASTVRKLASQESVHRNYERNGSANGRVGSNGSQGLASSYNGHEKLVSGDKLRNLGAGRAAPVWLETGEAVGSLYSETREEARDLARLRNACFEQARQAYLIGNKALAKELSVKGQLYNMKMKEAHGKARETIYRQRNPTASELLGNGRGQDRLIDLHGLHVSEAIHVLKHELSILRSTARSAGKRLQVMICVGTGHHTKGARTPARLPVAVEQYLLEEGLHYTQPQPGLLRVVIF